MAFWNRMSDLPSPLKSPVALATQSAPTAVPMVPVPTRLVPFATNVKHWPLPVSWIRMSERPSPLKSPVVRATQLAPVPSRWCRSARDAAADTVENRRTGHRTVLQEHVGATVRR